MNIKAALPATPQASPGPPAEEGKIGDESLVIHAPEEAIQVKL